MSILVSGFIAIIVIVLWECMLSSWVKSLWERLYFDHVSCGEQRVYGMVEQVSLPFQGFIRVTITQTSLSERFGVPKKTTEVIDFKQNELIPSIGSKITALVKPSRRVFGYHFGLRRRVNRVIAWHYVEKIPRNSKLMVAVS